MTSAFIISRYLYLDLGWFWDGESKAPSYNFTVDFIVDEIHREEEWESIINEFQE